MATEQEQNEAYREMAKENAYDILFERFCRFSKALKFQEMSLEEKKKELLRLVEKII